MADVRGRVLVIDDDEVVLIAITDLLEDAGYAVFSQTSPIGATSVISAESIDLAVIDINLPVMQGDAVVRLLRSWDKNKDLPIVIISGVAQSKLSGLQAELRNVRTLAKSALQDELVHIVDQLLSARVQVPASKSPRPPERAPELGAKFLSLLSAQLNGAPRAVRELRAGNEATRSELLRSVSLLRGQAHLLNFKQSSRLLGAIQLLLEAVDGKGLPHDVCQTLEDSMQALLTMSRADEFLFPPDAMIARLTQSLKQLQSAKR